MKRLVLLAAFGALFAYPASAHGPTPQRAEDSIVIAAEPEAVWAVVGDFASLADWHEAVATSEAESGTETGAERQVELAAGGTLVERLDRYDEETMTIAYRLATENIEAFPVSFYTARMVVRAAEDGTEVEWSGRFYRADTGNFPSEDQDDDAAVEAMSDFFQAGLEGLKAHIEGE